MFLKTVPLFTFLDFYALRDQSFSDIRAYLSLTYRKVLAPHSRGAEIPGAHRQAGMSKTTLLLFSTTGKASRAWTHLQLKRSSNR
jgi:hypothetical protein